MIEKQFITIYAKNPAMPGFQCFSGSAASVSKNSHKLLAYTAYVDYSPRVFVLYKVYGAVEGLGLFLTLYLYVPLHKYQRT